MVRIYIQLSTRVLCGQRHKQKSGHHGTVTAFQNERVHGTHVLRTRVLTNTCIKEAEKAWSMLKRGMRLLAPELKRPRGAS